MPPVARPGRRPGHQGQVFGRFLRLDRFGDVVVELNPDAVEPPPADTDVASVFDDDPLDRGQAPEQAHAVDFGPAQRVAGPGIAAMAVPEIVVPGSLIGELAMLVEHDYASTIVARGRVFCLKLIRMEMHAQMREDAALTEHFRDRMTERLLQTAEELRRIEDALAARSPATLQPSPEKFVAATGWYR